MAWAFIYIPSFKCYQRRLWRDCANVQPRQIIRCSHMWYFHELVHKFKPEPSSTSLHFNVFAVRICDWYQPFLNWRIKFGTSLHLHPFFLGIGCSQYRLVPNCLELVYKIWPVSSSTSLLFRDLLSANAISTKLSWTSLYKLASAFINMLLGYLITCSTKLAWTSLSNLAWVFTYISSFLGVRCSHMRLVLNFLELVHKIWHIPSF